MKYKGLKSSEPRDLVICQDCASVVYYWDRARHDMWHEKIENHTHTYSATFGQGSHWDEAGPARDHNCAYADDPRRCGWPGHGR